MLILLGIYILVCGGGKLKVLRASVGKGKLTDRDRVNW